MKQNLTLRGGTMVKLFTDGKMQYVQSWHGCTATLQAEEKHLARVKSVEEALGYR